MKEHLRSTYRLLVDGVDITPRIDGRLISLSFSSARGGEADTLDLVISDHDGAIELPRKGAEINLAFGWVQHGLVEKGTFVVDDAEFSGAPDQISITARSADMRGELPIRRTTSWHETTVGEIVETIAEYHGLQPAIADAVRAIPVSHLDQTDESDLNFLTRIAGKHDSIATVKAGHLLFMPMAQASTVSGAALPGVSIDKSDGDNYSYRVTDRESFTGVRAYWNDLATGERKEVVVGDPDRLLDLRATFATEDEARAEARSERQRIERGKAAFSMTLGTGQPDLEPERPLTLTGFKPPINDTPWIVTRVNQAVDDNGIVTSFEAETAQYRI